MSPMRLALWSAFTLVLLGVPRIAGAVVLEDAFGDLRMARAMSALNGGDARAAVDLLAPVLTEGLRNTTGADARFLAARAALRAGEPDSALTFLDGIDDLIPEITDHLWYLRATAYRSAGRWDRARSAWHRLLEIEHAQRSVEARFGLADAAYASGDLNAARAAYEDAITNARRSDRAMTARFNLGRIAEMQGRWNDAAEYYRYIAYRYPNHPLHQPALERVTFLANAGLGPQPTLGQQLFRVDRLLSARSTEEAATTLDALVPTVVRSSERAAVDFRRAQLAYRMHDYDSAAALFVQLSRTRNRRRRLEFESWLARTYSASGDYQAAIQVHLGIAERHDSAAAAKEALFKGAWLAYNGGDYQQAMKLFGEFIATYPRDSATSDAIWFLGWNAYHLGDLPTARDSFRELREQFPSSSLVQRAHYWEGRIAAQMGLPARALEHYVAAQGVRPLTYYAALAGQRRRELQELAGIANRGILVASLNDRLPVEETLEPSADELPEVGGMRPLRNLHVPWGASVFDWRTPEGRRLTRLIRVGLIDDAGELVQQMPVMPGRDISATHYARARLLWSLGDYNRAHRIIGSVFRSILRGRPDRESRRYFQLAYPAAFADLVSRAAEEFGVNPLLILSLMRQESAYDDHARSWASAVGLMQIIPRTGRKIAERLNVPEYNFGVLRDPAVNVRFGSWYLSQLITKFRGNTALAVGSYNAGPVAVSSWVDARPGSATDEFVEDIPYRETRNYVRRVLGNLAVYSAVYSHEPFDVPTRVADSYLDNVDF